MLFLRSGHIATIDIEEGPEGIPNASSPGTM
jgi:hypothetical protein